MQYTLKQCSHQTKSPTSRSPIIKNNLLCKKTFLLKSEILKNALFLIIYVIKYTHIRTNSMKNTKTEKNQNNLEDKKILSQNISFFRKKTNLSQVSLAAKLGTSNKNISKWEKGETIPDIFTVKKLASVFNVSTDTLLNPITEDNKIAITTKSSIPLKWKIYMLFLINSIIFLLGCVAFFVLTLSKNQPFPPAQIFLWVLPAINLSTFIMLCCIRKKVELISLSTFGWLVAISTHLTFINYPKIAYIYVLALAYQLLVVFMSMLINSGKIIKLNKIILQKLKKK